MATNDFIGFASSGNANVMSQADYAAAIEQGKGVQPGMASSKLANKIWRQGANMAAAVGELIKNHGNDALDNGDFVTLYNALLASTASTTLAGLMSATDKTKLDRLISTNATPSAAGYMSAADKTALDSIVDKGYAIVRTGNISVPSGVDTNISSYTFAKTGIYIATYTLDFKKVSATGARQLMVSATSGGANIDDSAVITLAPSSWGFCFVQLARIEKILVANTTRYLVATHTYGQAIDVSGIITVARLGDV